MKKRLLLIALVVALLLSSCGGGNTETTTTTDPAQVAETTETVVETELTPDIPDVRYDDAEFRILYRYGAHAYNIEDIWVESLTGEVINDAVYNRNIAVEEKFGLKLVPIEEKSPVAVLKKNVTAGDDFAEILADRKIELFPLTMQDMALDLHNLEYTDFTKPWWDGNVAEQMNIGGKLYMMVGDFNLISTCGVTFMWFNKSMLTDYGFTSPYEDAFGGTWTIDKMLEMVNAVSVDLNGDGKMDANDRYGFLSQVPYRMTTGFGVEMIERDEDGYPNLAPMSERLVNSMEIVISLMNDKEHTISYEEMAKGQDTSAYPHIYSFGRSKFVTDQILFVESGISMADEIREMTSAYGILPMPKLDESQERYYNIVDEYATAWVIPASSTHYDMTDVVMEYMSYASDGLVDAVYETTFKAKRMQAKEDAEMLDLIRSTTCYELTFIMNVGVREMLEEAVKSGNIASSYEKKATMIQKTLDSYKEK